MPRVLFQPALAWAMLASQSALAEPISADRPGIGSSAQVVPQLTAQAEVGSDNQEIRLGLIKGVEIDRDDTSWSAKLALVDRKTVKAAFKLSYDNDLHTVLEIPAGYTVNDTFGVSGTVIWSRRTQTYAAGVNVTPTTRLTISPMVYYDTKARAALFIAWLLPHHDQWQVDIGYDQDRIIAGISTAIDLRGLIRHHG